MRGRRPTHGRVNAITGQIDRMRAMVRGADGGIALELALIGPLLLLIVVGVIQFASLYLLQSHMFQVARETARSLVESEIDQSGAQTYAEARLLDWGITYTVTVIPPNPPIHSDYEVRISAPLADASPLDLFGLFQTGTLDAGAVMQQ